MLLDHSAGLPGTDYSDSLSYRPIPSYIDTALAGLRASRLKTTPGAMNVCCNDCFTLAGLVVERVSGKSFEDYVAENVLDPLGHAALDLPDVGAGAGHCGTGDQRREGRAVPDRQPLGCRVACCPPPTTWPDWRWSSPATGSWAASASCRVRRCSR